MFFAFVGLVIFASSVGYMYGEVMGWLTMGAGIMILSGINGVVSYLEDQRIERTANRED